MNILLAASEAHPLVKTGGLADVCGALPSALAQQGHDVRLVMPAYPQAVERAGLLQPVATLTLPGSPNPVRVLEGRLPDRGVRLYLIDAPHLFQRSGHIYLGPDGHDWPDNAARFAGFARAIVEIAMDRARLAWRPDVVHAHDWQSGLVPALLALEAGRPSTVFTIHNLAYQGVFERSVFDSLALPAALWSLESAEFWGRFSFIKGGIATADFVTTVSPSYAREICTPQYGYGLEGLLRHRGTRLVGVLNGVDYAQWDPRHDTYIEAPFAPDHLEGKARQKQVLQEQFGLTVAPDAPLLGHIGRLVEQKGADLIAAVIPELAPRGVQFAFLGSGEKRFEEALREAARRFPGQVGLHVGYHEALAHRIEAGCDMFLMPSRFEPCGLNQIYSLRYGTIPVVHRTGGLADTVIDTMEHTLRMGIATGFVFDTPEPWALASAVGRALDLYAQPPLWRRLVIEAMGQDFGWEHSARQYLALYRQANAARG